MKMCFGTRCVVIVCIFAAMTVHSTASPTYPFGTSHGNSLTSGALVFGETVCSAITQLSGFISAVPRQCHGGVVETCDSICSKVGQNAPDAQRKSMNIHSCVNSLHVYPLATATNLNDPGLKVYKYNSCNS